MQEKYNHISSYKSRVGLLIDGDVEVYGIALLSFSSSGISVILILISGIAVSSSPAVWGFSSFWLTVFGKRRYVEDPSPYCGPFIWPLLSNVGQYLEDLRLNGK